jgi:hypothetical protein
MSPSGRVFRAFCVVALLLFGVGELRAQAGAGAERGAFVAEGLGRGTVAVDGPWQFRAGDDLAWAAPGFDDSGWETIDVSRAWGDQGHWAYAGRAWYRRTIDFKDLSGAIEDVAVYVPDTSCAYEVYWNGRLIGRTDAMPAATMINSSGAAVFRLGKPERGVLAFRASTEPMDSTSPGNQIGLMAVPRIGSTEAIGDLAGRERAALLRSRLLTIAQIVMYGQLSLLALVVWLRFRDRKVLFWMFAFLLSSTLWIALDQTLFPWLLNWPLIAGFYGPTFHSMEDVALWFLLLYLLELDQYPALVKWTKVLAWITLCSAIGDGLVFDMPHRDAHVLLFEVLDAIATIGFSLPAVFPLVLIALAFRKKMNPARKFVAIAAFLSDIYFVAHHTAVQGERFTRLTFGDRMMNPMFTIWGVEVSMPAVLSLLLVCAIVYALYEYMVEQGQRQGVMLQEYRNARAVQQVLIPENAPDIPGYAIQSVYKPYGEVGGDFFQVIPLADGSVLVVVGDVSGKGMPAAMLVSLLVGTLRTLAHYTRSPGAMMAAMNQRLIGRSNGGFTTCLVLRADPDGTLTMANAGHISPYLAGRELVLETGLPLGIVWSPAYAETTFKIAVGEQLTMVTDGVVEARDASGTLLGFERTTALSVESAEVVAEAAEGFGQDDDITVLTLTRVLRGRREASRDDDDVVEFHS